MQTEMITLYSPKKNEDPIDCNKENTHLGLKGDTKGAIVNRILNCFSVSTLIVAGNESYKCNSGNYLAGGYYLFISRTAVYRKYAHLRLKYLKLYEEWMVDAVSNFISIIDSYKSPVILFINDNNEEKLFIDMKLTGSIDSITQTKWVRVFLKYDIERKSIELIFDTIHFDNRNFNLPL